MRIPIHCFKNLVAPEEDSGRVKVAQAAGHGDV